MRLISCFAVVASFGVLSVGCADDMGEDEGRGSIVCGALAAYSGLTRPGLFLQGEGEEEFSLCEARVVARDGDFEATLSANEGRCDLFTMPDRFGTYEVTVEKAGYQTAALSGVVVDNTPFGCAGPPQHDVKLARVAQGCDGAKTRSLQIDLRDEAGAPICDARVVAIEGDFRRVFSSSVTKEGACVWGGPSERPGTYQVAVSRPGYEPLVVPSLVVPIDASGCHVVPAKVAPKLVRSSAACTAEVVESLEIDVRDEKRAIVCDASVVVHEDEFEVTLVPVVEGDRCRWTGLPERKGTYEIEVKKPGYRDTRVGVTVEASACHVKPVEVDVDLNRL
jgi:hypothetical protein